MFKEGDDPKNVYIIKQGEFQITKSVLMAKTTNHEHDLLTKSTQTTIRYNSNFGRQIGLKKDFESAMRLVGSCTMVGDYECIYNIPHLCTISCYSPEATVYLIKKEEFLKLEATSEDAWKEICKSSG